MNRIDEIELRLSKVFGEVSIDKYGEIEDPEEIDFVRHAASDMAFLLDEIMVLRDKIMQLQNKLEEVDKNG